MEHHSSQAVRRGDHLWVMESRAGARPSGHRASTGLTSLRGLQCGPAAALLLLLSHQLVVRGAGAAEGCSLAAVALAGDKAELPANASCTVSSTTSNGAALSLPGSLRVRGAAPNASLDLAYSKAPLLRLQGKLSRARPL